MRWELVANSIRMGSGGVSYSGAILAKPFLRRGAYDDGCGSEFCVDTRVYGRVRGVRSTIYPDARQNGAGGAKACGASKKKKLSGRRTEEWHSGTSVFSI